MIVEKVLYTAKGRTTGSWKDIFMKHSLLRLVFVILLAAQAAPNAAWAQVQVPPPIPGVIGKVQSFTGRSLDVQTPTQTSRLRLPTVKIQFQRPPGPHIIPPAKSANARMKQMAARSGQRGRNGSNH